MDVSRRKLFGIGAAFAAAAAVPEIADAKPAEPVGPMMFEHTCDGGASRLTLKEVREVQKEAPWMYRGCGTTFRWYFGTLAMCPNCGYAYCVELKDIKSGFYKRIQ